MSLRPHAKFYRPEIDGLRCLAIIPVVLFHANLGCPGGYIGVDVFFVISGFLIGGILFRELDAGTFSFKAFWQRRARRVLPALLLVLEFSFLAGWVFFSNDDLPVLGEQARWALFGASNFKLLALTSGYWGTRADSLVLLHTWSLAVEEQFYLLLPLLLGLCYPRNRRATFYLLVALGVASFGLSLYWGKKGYAGNFYLLPSRGWELLLGCIGALAVYRDLRVPKNLRQVATLSGIVLVVASAFIFGNDPKWPDAKTLAPTFGTFLILIFPSAEPEKSLAARILSSPPLRFIGLISYSVYLWHWPVFFLLKEYGPMENSVWARLAGVGVSLVLGALSWRFVEQPCRNKTQLKIGTRRFLMGAGLIWLALFAQTIEVDMTSVQNDDNQGIVPPFFKTLKFTAIAGFDATPTLEKGGIQFNASNEMPRCVVLGSSHGMMLGPLLKDLSDTYHVSCALFCEPAKSPLFSERSPLGSAIAGIDPEARKRDEVISKYIATWNPQVVLIADRWDLEIADWHKPPETMFGTFEESYSNTVRWLAAHATRVVVLGETPQLPFSDGDKIGRLIWKEYCKAGHTMPDLYEPSEVEAHRLQALSIFQKFSGEGVSVVDLAPLLEITNHGIHYHDKLGLLYFDFTHLTPKGSMELRPALEPIFKSLQSGKR